MHNAATQIRNSGVKVTEVDELATPSTQTSAVQNLARSNQLVILDGGITASIQSIAKRYPNVQFVMIGGALPASANNHSTAVDWPAIGYLAGVAAAHVTKTHVIGFIGGLSIPVISQAQQGYTAGAKSVDPSIKVLSTIIGSFTDAGKGKAAAQAQIAAGADVIYADLDQAHAGIVQAAKEASRPTHVIGSISVKCGISQGLDLGDTLNNISAATVSVAKTYAQQGNLPATIQLGLKGGLVSFALCPNAPASAAAAVNSAKAAIVAGKVHP